MFGTSIKQPTPTPMHKSETAEEACERSNRKKEGPDRPAPFFAPECPSARASKPGFPFWRAEKMRSQRS